MVLSICQHPSRDITLCERWNIRTSHQSTCMGHHWSLYPLGIGHFWQCFSIYYLVNGISSFLPSQKNHYSNNNHKCLFFLNKKNTIWIDLFDIIFESFVEILATCWFGVVEACSVVIRDELRVDKVVINHEFCWAFVKLSIFETDNTITD